MRSRSDAIEREIHVGPSSIRDSFVPCISTTNILNVPVTTPLIQHSEETLRTYLYCTSRPSIMKALSIGIPILVVIRTTQAMDWGRMDQYKATLVWEPTLESFRSIDNS
jgi:hypothetical protein